MSALEVSASAVAPAARTEAPSSPGLQEGLANGLSGGNRGPDVVRQLQHANSAHDAIVQASRISVEPPNDLPVINPATGKREPTYNADQNTDPKNEATIKAAQAAVNGGSTEAGMQNAGQDKAPVRSPEAAAVNQTAGGSAQPPEALTSEQLKTKGELTKIMDEGKATAAQQAQLNKIKAQERAYSDYQGQQLARGKEISDALHAGQHTGADGKDFSPQELALADRYRAEQLTSAASPETKVPVSSSFAERSKSHANKQAAFDQAVKSGQFARDKSEATPRPTDPILGVEQGRPLSEGEQAAYDKHMHGIESKIANGQPITKQEAQDYKEHLQREEYHLNEAAHPEAVDLGTQINKELADPKNTTGEMTPETKERFVAFIDSLTGGAYSKNTLFAEALGLNLLDDKGKARVAEKLQKLAENMTPEKAKQINERLQLLAQLEVQVYSLRAQRDENALSARDVKQFIKDNYADYNPQDDPDSLTDQIAMEKRQKWIQTLSMLNAYKAAIGAAEKSHVILLQEAGQVRVDLYKALGVNKGERFMGMVVRRLGNYAERRTADALIAGKYDEIEDRVNVSAAARANHKSPDMSGLKP